MLEWLFPEILAVGVEAPDFGAVTDEGVAVHLSDYRGKQNVVLVFYPRDFTTICTRQLCEFRESWTDAIAAGAAVLGVNPGSAASHAAFRKKCELPYPILVDEGQRVAQLYGAKSLMVRRTVYLIGKSGKVRYARRGKPQPSEVLAAAE